MPPEKLGDIVVPQFHLKKLHSSFILKEGGLGGATGGLQLYK